ncbi:MAG: peptide-methionine (R)-S-oxide reductase MsrB [Halieaceae bacterium]|nr:peptide-methionine (R)-S-oxide reductase MsrB [Halieaceae bacterium]
MAEAKSEDYWRDKLTPQEYAICRGKGTEPAFSGKYWDCKEQGVYHCKCCGQALFLSTSKYDSGSGWPSFFQPAEADAVQEARDISHGMIRTEVMCERCGAHLGHVFEDGPQPTGLRYCINSASIDLQDN